MSDTQKDLLAKLKTGLREAEIPFFSDEELLQIMERNNNDFDACMYNACIIKSENCSISVSNLSLPDSSAYWLRMAMAYRPSATTVVDN